MGNHYIGIPVIDCRDGSIRNANIVSMPNQALVDMEDYHYYLALRGIWPGFRKAEFMG
ncbi:hypothetical protein CEB3_c04290 [Peptococcaceae bacterium CEB3]|nr:hypothetical protein CEB3_c04290 [Peptococcaceae bacterium CEB3]